MLVLFHYSHLLSAQTQQNINKTSGTASNPITEIDSNRFDANTNQILVLTTRGNESHALAEINNDTFNAALNLTPFAGGITTVTEIDGNIFPLVQIGNQYWTAENLRTTKYNNDTLIPNQTTNANWMNITHPAW